jgi:uncharacterized membrane protein
MKRSKWLVWGPLVVLYLFGVAAVVGYATFGLRPWLLAGSPRAAAFYPHSFWIFSVGHIVLAAAVLLGRLVDRADWRWLPAFGALYAISLAAELAGTTVGLPFGEYSYSTLLGPMWFGHVPLVIPLSWFCMALPSYAVARLAFPAAPDRWKRIFAGSLVLLAWDLALDPAMSYATRYWTWGTTGPYYGMPWLNLFGWYATGVALMAALAKLRADAWIARLGAGWLAAYYGANLLVPMGMNAAAGLWSAVLATVGVLALLAAWLQGSRAPGAAASAARRGGGVELVSSHVPK